MTTPAMSTASPAPLATSALRYRQQDSTLTLQEGLNEYFHTIPGLIDVDALEGSSKELFTNHDIAHVVFGCDISLRQEVMMDTWTVFGTDVGIVAYTRYLRTPEAQRLVKEIGVGRALWGALVSLPDVVRVIVRALRMKKKWSWSDHERYMQRPLADIRAELGLVVVP